jgi:hypothetical protein
MNDALHHLSLEMSGIPETVIEIIRKTLATLPTAFNNHQTCDGMTVLGLSTNQNKSRRYNE